MDLEVGLDLEDLGLVDAFLEEVDDAARHEAQALYLQGVQDGIEILKCIGIFK